MASMRCLEIFLVLLLVLGGSTAALGQERPSSVLPRMWTADQRETTTRLPARPMTASPESDLLLRQGTAALIGGVAGSLLLVFPFAMAEYRDRDVSRGAGKVAAMLGYMGGSAVGVQFYSRRRGLQGSWWTTLGGAVLGGLGGPLLLVTVPIGATAGFNLSPYVTE